MSVSVWESLLNAAEQRAIGLAGCPVVKVKRKLRFLQGDPLPCVIIAPAGPESVAFETMSNDTAMAFPIGVAIVDRSDRNIEDLSMLTLRERLLLALYYQTHDAVATAYQGEISLGAVLEDSGDPGSNYDVTGFVVTYSAVVQRES